MQDIGPDMEDLLRKASENYPLKQTEDRWDEIASKISSGTMPNPMVQKTISSKKYFAASLLLLMFLFLGLFILRKAQSHRPVQKVLVKTEGSSQKVNAASTKQLPFNTKEKMNKGHQATTNNDNAQFNDVKRSLNSTVSRYNSINDLRTVGFENIDKQKSINAENDSVNYAKPISRSNKDNDAIGKIIIGPYVNEISLRLKTFSLATANHFISATLHSQEKKAKNLFSGKGLYYGLIAGPGFSTIKNQGLKKAGLNIGILGGYRFTKALSFETGLLLSQKFYTTSGELFSMKVIGPSMPSAMRVMQVDGSTRIIEIPLHLRYDIFQNTKRSFFSLTGLSSYIVDKESNRYHASMNGTEEMVYGTYKSNRSYFASSINLSIGYEQRLNRKNVIRFQPYIQLPAKGIGVGELHVMSTGLYVGIIRSAL